MSEETKEPEEAGLVPVVGGAMEVSPEMAAELADLQQSAEELGGGLLDMLSIYKVASGRWQTGPKETPIKKDSLTGIFLHSVRDMRSFWPPDAPMGNEPPTCWSMGGEDAKPHEKAIEAQHATCEGCPWNEWGTALNQQGQPAKGKACKTKRADFFVELAPDRLETDENGYIKVTGEAVIGVALIRASATARPTRASIGQWAKDLRQEANGVPQLVVTEWAFAPAKGGGVDFEAPVLKCKGRYSCDNEALQEIVKLSKDLREGEAEEIMVTLAGTADKED